VTHSPLIIDGPAEGPLPAYPLPAYARDRHPLYVVERTIYRRLPFGWQRIPRGYVTDFASIPLLATMATVFSLQPLGPWAWAALSHDFGYAVGEPGKRPLYDDAFHALMKVDGVDGVVREVMYRAVRIGGNGGYVKAPSWWDTENFADPERGTYPIPPPFAREDAFIGARWGVQVAPQWQEAVAA
jgi:hypothetical protein